ncbi:hypothetical protein LCGC14_2463880, partial [marine sediment metagenome]
MKIVEELNKEWQVQGFSKGVKLEEVKQIKEGWI